MSKSTPKGISTKKLQQEIDRIKKKKILKNKVVSLADYRQVKQAQPPKRLLIVDDDETTRKVLKRLFEKEGYRVLLAQDATGLVAKLESETIELILLDINLPWVNGFELCKLLKEHDDLKRVPIIFISGRKSEIDKKHAFKLGAHDYITKPFNIRQVTETVRTLINLHSAR